nr:extensin family protein [Paracoccus saliphilus]
MRMAVVLGLVLFGAGPGVAQDRPPAAPDAAPLTEVRPPERPEPPADAPAPDAPPPAATAPETPEPAIAQGSEAPAAGESFGPPAPPVWFTQAESDAEFAACRLALALLGTTYRQEPPVAEAGDRDCGIARPLRVSQIVPGVALTGEPVMRCGTARALGFWARDFLRPAAALMPDAPRLTAIETGSGYTCRDRVGTGAARPKPSEHGNGNAIDVMGFRFDNDQMLSVQPREGDGAMAEAFQRAARSTACLLFTTVLGPGSNAAHDDHLHLDLAARKGSWRLCE